MNKSEDTVDLIGYVRCPICAKLFADPNAQRVFCSYHCRRKAQYRAAKREATCAFCATTFLSYDPRQRYCALECRRKAEAARVRTGPVKKPVRRPT